LEVEGGFFFFLLPLLLLLPTSIKILKNSKLRGKKKLI